MTVDRRHEYRDFDPEILRDFLGESEIVDAERIGTGKSNTNYKLSLSNDSTVVARLYSNGSPSSPAREMLIAEMIANAGVKVPVPEMLSNGSDWAVFEFVEGDLLSKRPEHSGAAGELIGQLSHVKLSASNSVGWITETGEIVPFEFGDDYFGMMLSKEQVREWLGVDRIAVLGRILSGEKSRLVEIHEHMSLTHGDFNPSNVLVRNEEISAVLDWEYGHVGTPYMDIGNLLRNIPDEYHESVGVGLVRGGFELPPDWKQRAQLIDLSSHLEFLTSSRSDEFKRTRVDLIEKFIKSFSSD